MGTNRELIVESINAQRRREGKRQKWLESSEGMFKLNSREDGIKAGEVSHKMLFVIQKSKPECKILCK